MAQQNSSARHYDPHTSESERPLLATLTPSSSSSAVKTKASQEASPVITS